jgi:phosphoserine aminotransferase
MNLTAPQSTVDYINTGHWSQKAITEAARYAGARGRRCRRQYTRVPAAVELKFSEPPPLCALHAE